MNKLMITAAVSAALLAPPAFAGHDDRYERGWEWAKVVRVDPIYRSVRVSHPYEECFEEPVTERTVYRGGHDPGAALVGGIIGGVIGHQFGKNHRDGHLATAAGAFIGANHAARHHGYRGERVVERTVYETRCRTVREARHEDRIDGYDVTYKYHGRLYHTHTAHHPGKRIRVRHEPVSYRYEDD
jgi:uncharacterized protein YcfJ